MTGADVSKRKDGSITKSTLVKGQGREVPNDGATCDGRTLSVWSITSYVPFSQASLAVVATVISVLCNFYSSLKTVGFAC